jgi:hypothetical protein
MDAIWRRKILDICVCLTESLCYMQIKVEIESVSVLKHIHVQFISSTWFILNKYIQPAFIWLPVERVPLCTSTLQVYCATVSSPILVIGLQSDYYVHRGDQQSKVWSNSSHKNVSASLTFLSSSYFSQFFMIVYTPHDIYLWDKCHKQQSTVCLKTNLSLWLLL